MNYDEVVVQLMTMSGIPHNSEDSNFTRILPTALLYAEGRIHRDLNILATNVNLALPVTAGSRDLALPREVLEVRSANIFTPAGAVTSNSRRRPLERISPEALDMFWPQENFRPGIPRKYAIIGIRVPAVIPPIPPFPPQPAPPIFIPERFSYLVRLMPTPDRAYVTDLIIDADEPTLSRINPVTFLSDRYPELLCAGCMIWIAGHQRDYGAQADDPTRAMSWNTVYMQLLSGISQETSRMRGEGPGGFTALPPAPSAQQPR